MNEERFHSVYGDPRTELTSDSRTELVIADTPRQTLVADTTRQTLW
jgi:hypothetical protein